MEITEISIKLRDEKKLKAFVNIAFDNVFAVKGLKVIKGSKGYLLCMPSRKADNMQRDVAHPISREFRQEMEKRILEEYHRVAAIAAANGGDGTLQHTSFKKAVGSDLLDSNESSVWQN